MLVSVYETLSFLDTLMERQIGLFAPRAGQNFRDEQRRRRSQYDRGTRLAEIEDHFGFDPCVSGNKSNQSHPFSSINQYGRYSHSHDDSY